jgi:MT-A70
MTKKIASDDLKRWCGARRFTTLLVDPPWRFQNSTGKVAPEHRRLSRYRTLTLDEIKALPVGDIVNSTAHLYLWVPNALIDTRGHPTGARRSNDLLALTPNRYLKPLPRAVGQTGLVPAGPVLLTY